MYKIGDFLIGFIEEDGKEQGKLFQLMPWSIEITRSGFLYTDSDTGKQYSEENVIRAPIAVPHIWNYVQNSSKTLDDERYMCQIQSPLSGEIYVLIVDSSSYVIISLEAFQALKEYTL